MAGTNQIYGRSNQGLGPSARQDLDFGPVRPDISGWTARKNTGSAFPLTDPSTARVTWANFSVPVSSGATTSISLSGTQAQSGTTTRQITHPKSGTQAQS